MNIPTDFRRWIRPSFLPVLAMCPASARMSEEVVNRFGEPPAEEVAELGSDMHAAVMLSLDPLTADSEAQPNTEATLAKFPLLSEWDKACVGRCVEFAAALVRKTRNDYPDQPLVVLLEHHMDGSVLGIERGGTADMVIVVPFKLARVVDWKCGFLDQGDAAEHEALSTYAVMAAATFKAVGIEVFLFQPRAEFKLRASGARFAAAELKAQETWTRVVVQAAIEENPEAVAGLHCTKCRALPRCPVAQEMIVRFKEAMEFIGDPSDAEAWADQVDASKVAEKYAEETYALAKARLGKGLPISRWFLQSSGDTRKIDAKLAMQLAKDAGVFDHLLQHVMVKASAADAVPAIAEAVTVTPKAPSLKPMRASSP